MVISHLLLSMYIRLDLSLLYTHTHIRTHKVKSSATVLAQSHLPSEPTLNYLGAINQYRQSDRRLYHISQLNVWAPKVLCSLCKTRTFGFYIPFGALLLDLTTVHQIPFNCMCVVRNSNIFTGN